jgi:hypothetical protein
MNYPIGETTKTPDATLYAWETAGIFDFDLMLTFLGGQQLTTPKEFRLHMEVGGLITPIYCTNDFQIFPVTKEDQERGYEGINSIDEKKRFKTSSIEERFRKLGLDLPDWEILFDSRLDNGPFIDVGIITELATVLDIISLNQYDILAVRGTAIEETPLYASRRIAESLGITIEQV